MDRVGFHEDGVLLNWKRMPTAISMFTFCYHGHTVFPTICGSMKDRRQFSKIEENSSSSQNAQLSKIKTQKIDASLHQSCVMQGEVKPPIKWGT
ncbi:Amino acid transporter, transmembrane [Corchorus olitorius]|uniref:Amino acid transporter, transmembrane n=1 Tax=Corchorus olitorius TaxID=93759 RepID=A0A1R3GSH9_9ROSI|nr:Amino acid transporter, transmembrane [Corchorus olitorius]